MSHILLNKCRECGGMRSTVMLKQWHIWRILGPAPGLVQELLRLSQVIVPGMMKHGRLETEGSASTISQADR